MKTNKLNLCCGIAALYMAVSYIAGIAIFIFNFDYLNISNDQKLKILADNQSTYIFTNLIMYIIFGVLLLMFSVFQYEKLKNENVFAKLFLSFGIMWSVMLIVSGMIANAGIKSTLELLQHNPKDAESLWQTIEIISGGIGGAYGEIAGGMFTLFFTLTIWRMDYFPKILNYIGILTGIVGGLSTLPLLRDLTGLFGIIQIIWFVWIGILLIKKQSQF